MPVNDFDAILNAPGVDLTGTNPANLVDKEDQILNPPRYMDRHFIVPAEGPLFEAGVRVWRVSTDPNGGTVLTELAKNVDWFLTHKYMEASYYLGDAAPPKQLATNNAIAPSFFPCINELVVLVAIVFICFALICNGRQR